MPRLTPCQARLVEEHLPLIGKEVARLRIPPGARDDATQTAAVGMCEAAARFDPARGVPFPAYARIKIRTTLIDEYRRATGWRRTVHAEVVSLDAPTVAHPDGHADTLIADTPDPATVAASRADTARMLATFPRNAADRQVLEGIAAGLTQRAVAEALGVDESRIVQRLTSIRRRVRPDWSGCIPTPPR